MNTQSVRCKDINRSLYLYNTFKKEKFRGMREARYFFGEGPEEKWDSTGGLGIHLILELYDCDPQILDRSTEVKEIMIRAAEATGLEVLDFRSHQFNPHGVTSMVLLGESHLSIHTWPEHGFAAVDIFVCGKEVWKAVDVIREGLKPDRVEVMELIRGVGIEKSR